MTPFKDVTKFIESNKKANMCYLIPLIRKLIRVSKKFEIPNNQIFSNITYRDINYLKNIAVEELTERYLIFIVPSFLHKKISLKKQVLQKSSILWLIL